MGFFEIVAVLLAVTSFVAWMNSRFVKLPGGIGITVTALASSVLVIVAGNFSPELVRLAKGLVASFDFRDALFHGMLAFLLFAGALHIDTKSMSSQKWSILLLSTLAVVISTFTFGASIHFIGNAIGVDLSWGQALLFGAIISPTDPITALAMLKKADIDPRLEAKIAGESLFNDGAALVLFAAILPFAVSPGAHQTPEIHSFFVSLATTVMGGALIGLSIGGLAHVLIEKVNDYVAEILLTLAAAATSWVIAEHFSVSAPISTVCAGLLVGLGSPSSLSDQAKEHVFPFWGLVDNILNTMLFTLVGLELMLMSLSSSSVITAILSVPVALMARYVSVWLPLFAISGLVHIPKRAAAILTWGGLRGAISVAMALSLPKFAERDAIVVATYFVVVFSIIVQGLSLPKFAIWAHDPEGGEEKG